MIIVEAIKTVLNQVPDGLTSKEIYDEIVKRNLYSFGAKDLLGVFAPYDESVPQDKDQHSKTIKMLLRNCMKSV